MSLRRFVYSFLAAGAGFALCFGVSGCGGNGNGKKKVVCTVTMIADLAERVSGGKVDIDTIMGPDSDPHTYKVLESHVRRIRQGDLVLYNGLHLEGTMVKILENNSRAKAVTRDIPKDRLLREGGEPDPHVWFDVSLWIYALGAVEQELIALDPDNADLYRKNAADYRKELEALHAEVKTRIAEIPKKQRVMITAHDAFRYFERAYDIEVHGLQGVSTASQVSLKWPAELVDMIVAKNVKAVFAETSVSDDGMNALIAQCKDKNPNHMLKKAGERLFSDAMDPPGTPGGTYPGMVRHNVRVIVDALK